MIFSKDSEYFKAACLFSCKNNVRSANHQCYNVKE